MNGIKYMRYHRFFLLIRNRKPKARNIWSSAQRWIRSFEVPNSHLESLGNRTTKSRFFDAKRNRNGNRHDSSVIAAIGHMPQTNLCALVLKSTF